MNKGDLELFIAAGFSTHRIAKAMATSQNNVRYWLKKHGLETAPYTALRCGRCGETDPKKFYGHKKRICGKCHNEDTISRGAATKKRARDYLGGKCAHCGYDKYQVALDFHHLDPSLKDPSFNSMRSWCWDRVEAELQDCILLCKNCHAALHAGLWQAVSRQCPWTPLQNLAVLVAEQLA